MDGWVKLSGARVKRRAAARRSAGARSGAVRTIASTRPTSSSSKASALGAGRIDPVGAVALGEPQEFLRLPQTRPQERARSSTVMNWPTAGPQPLGLVDAAIRGGQKLHASQPAGGRATDYAD
jgi:hypothetical protein